MKSLEFSYSSFLIAFALVSGALLLCPTTSWAASCQSNTTGNWSEVATWTNCGDTTPQTADTVQIMDGHTVILDTNATSSSITIDSGGTLTEDGGGRFLCISGTGGWTNNGTFTSNAETVTLGNANMPINGETTFNNLHVDGVSKGYTFNATSTVTGNLRIDNTSVTSGYIRFLSGVGDIIALGDIYLDAADSNIKMLPTLIINGISDQTLTVVNGSETSGFFFPLQINKPSGILFIDGTLRTAKNWTYLQGDLDTTTYEATIVFAGALTISGSHSLYNVIFNSNSGSTVSYNLSSGITLTVLNDLKIDNSLTGQIKIINSGSNIEVLGNINIDSANFEYSGTIVLSPNFIITGSKPQILTLTGGSETVGLFASTTVNKSGGTLIIDGILRTTMPFTVSSGTVDWTTNDATLSIAGALSASNSNLGPTLNNLYIDSTGVYTPADDLILTGDFTNAGTFTHNSKTVTFAGSETATISGESTFYNLTSNTAGKTLVFPAGITTTVAGTLNLQGESGNPLILKSSAVGVDGEKTDDEFSLAVTTPGTLQYLTVYDSIATNPLTGNNSTDGGNTTGWSFSSPDDTTPPSAGTIEFSSVSTNSITASSTGASDDVGLATSPYLYHNVTTGAFIGPTTTSAIFTDLTRNTSYTFEIGVQDLAGNWATTTQSATTTLTTCTSVSQNGITWTFDDSYECGQFFNGDWWVVGPLTVVSVSPAPSGTGETFRNGSMANPVPGSSHGYDGRSVVFDEDLALTYPYSMANNVSLVSSISRPEDAEFGTGFHRGKISDAAVLTSLAMAPAEGTFRPSYSDPDKTLHNVSSMDISFLPSLDSVASTPTLSSFYDGTKSDGYDYTVIDFSKVWLDHVIDYYNQHIHPMNHMPYYGREISTYVGEAALMMLLGDVGDRTELAQYLVQLGIDLYGVVDNGGYWPNNGGHNQGRKWPILFAGQVLDDSDMLGIGSREKTGTSWRFQEDDQTFYVSQEDVDRLLRNEVSFDVTSADSTSVTGILNRALDGYAIISKSKIRVTSGTGAGQIRTIVSSTQERGVDIEIGENLVIDISEAWETIPDETSVIDILGYEESDIGLAEWGITHSFSVSIDRDNPAWDADYRNVNGPYWTGFVLAAMLLGQKEAWNHDALFDYVDRFVEVTSDDGEFPGSSFASTFTGNMWDAYRSTFIEPDIISPTPGSVSFSNVTDTSITVLSSGAEDETALAALPYQFRNVTDDAYTSATSSTSWLVTGLTPETAYTFEIGVQDLAGNWATTTQAATTTPAETPVDSTPPVLSSGAPSGSQSAGTTQITLQVSTNESATCKYGTTANTAYADIANTFSTTGGTTHTQTITGLSNGTSYTYYIRCTDGSNPNTSDYTISFSIASPASGGSISSSGSINPNFLRQVTPPPVTPTLPAFTFTRDLKLGMTGTDVRSLQVFLNTHGYTVAAADAGSIGQETTYFGPATQAALIRYQRVNNITPAIGYFGPVSRAAVYLASLSPAQSTASSTPTATTTPVSLSPSHTFTIPLSLGQTHLDVLVLQRFLNTDPETRIAQIGIGSPGHETTYFGNLTLDAIKRFQIKYDIAKLGNSGFGHVGPATRAKLNSLLESR